MAASILLDIGFIILFAAILASITKLLKQPLVLGYVIAGLLIGPTVLGLVSNQSLIIQLSELGIAFLLFVVGLEMDLNKFKQLGPVIVIVGTLQVILVGAIGAVIAKSWLTTNEAIYIGLIVAFSSTMLVVKLLGDKGELQTLHGKLILGILLMQDILVVIALSVMQTLGNLNFLGLLPVAKGLFLIAVSYFIGKHLFNYILKFAASSAELLFIVALAIGSLYTALAYYLGFSISIGAFVAGVALASSKYAVEITGRIISLKDFFLIIFFVSLGMQITGLGFGSNFNLFIILLILVLLVKPLIIFLLLKLFKHSNRTSFSSALALAQISEFSLILAGSGVVLGFFSKELLSLVIILGAVTFTLTSYIINYDRNIYSLIHPALNSIETNPKNFSFEKINKKLRNHVVVIGAHRMSSAVIEVLKKNKKEFVVLDFNPEKVKILSDQGINCFYGDYGNVHVLESLQIGNAKMIISSVPNFNDNLRLLKIAKSHNPHIITIIKANAALDALLLYKEGADFVVFPEYLSGLKVADYLVHLDNKGIKKWGKVYQKKLIDEITNNRLFV